MNTTLTPAYSFEKESLKDKLNFKKITHDNMPVIWEYVKNAPGRTTDFSYGGILMWVDMFMYEFAIYKDTLFIKGVVENDRTKPAFSLPIGTLPLKDSISILRKYCEQENIPLELSAVPEESLEEIKELNPKTIELLEDWSDYLYDAEMLAELKGKKMGKKRNHVNSFIAHNPEWKYDEMNSQNVKDAIGFMDIYESEIDDSYMAKAESMLTRKILNAFSDGDNVMKGGILYDKPGSVCAITIGDVRGDTLYVHIEKGAREVNGSYEMINKEFASHNLKENPSIRFINREDDSGDEGLRKAKESYHPLGLMRKYNVIF